VKNTNYPLPIRTLVGELKRLPGIGPRSAERIALWMVQSRDARSADVAAAIQAVSEKIRPCKCCGFFTEAELCEYCSDDTRDKSVLCIVEQPTDVLPLERTGRFRGRYHALGGRISPLEHIGPEHLRIAELIVRIRDESPQEIILALGSDVEGEATANYIASILRDQGLQITRLAQGLPAGGGLEHADELTLSRALSGRTKV
jgi:recombination protein RecR